MTKQQQEAEEAGRNGTGGETEYISDWIMQETDELVYEFRPKRGG